MRRVLWVIGILALLLIAGYFIAVALARKKIETALHSLRMEGSLMNSGTVAATTELPLHKGDPYKVEGAFHDLDVTGKAISPTIYCTRC